MRPSSRVRVAVLAGAACLTVAACKSTGPTLPQPVGQSKPNPTNDAPLDAASEFKASYTKAEQADVHLDLGKTLERQGELEQAIGEYQKALELSPGRGVAAKRALAHRRLGGALDRLGRFDQAEGHYADARKLAPRDPKVWNDQGYSYYLQGRWEEAERALTEAARLAPDDPLIRNNLGLAQAGAGKLDPARKSLAKTGGEAVAHANLAYVLAATGRRDEARAEYQRAIDIQPRLASAREALTRLGPADAAPVDTGLLRASAAAQPPPP